MPTYRRPGAVGDALRTLIDGTVRDIEVLVRDDGPGSDATCDAVREAARGDARVRYHRNEHNLGMPENLNRGIEESTGDYVLVCHDHDLYAPRFVETLTELLDRYPSATYAHCAIEMMRPNGAPQGIRHVGDWPEITPGRAWLRKMLRSFGCPVSALTMVRRSAYEAAGLYDPEFGFVADVEMWMRLTTHGDVAYSRDPLVRVCEREENHEATADPWPSMASIFATHLRYAGVAYPGLAAGPKRLHVRLSADVSVARMMASRIKRRRRALPSNSRRLAEVGGPVCKLARLASLLGQR